MFYPKTPEDITIDVLTLAASYCYAEFALDAPMSTLTIAEGIVIGCAHTRTPNKYNSTGDDRRMAEIWHREITEADAWDEILRACRGIY